MNDSKSNTPNHAGGSNESEAVSSPVVRTSEGSADSTNATLTPVVGIGASAGGLEALKRLFAHVPADSGIAFVVVQHLDPERPSMLSSVLNEVTRLAVVEARDGMPAEPDRVHVIPSDSDISIRDGVLKLTPRQLTGRLHLPIDAFFRSLADETGSRAVGVVLSGSGADGTRGLEAVKAAGGTAIAQDPKTAQFPAMPESALAAGVVDFSGTPEQIAGELEHLFDAVTPSRIEDGSGEALPEQEKRLAEVFALVRKHANIDFSRYKRTTVLRRIEKRMGPRRVGLAEYATLLHDDPDEARALARDMLIHVTSFFRDPDAFAALQQSVFEEFAQHKPDGGSIRIWVPGCSTGEEVYGLAICLLESLGTRSEELEIKLFGTDLSEQAIETARAGRYPEADLANVAPERLSRFFERFDCEYQIAEDIRDLCVFVKHDVTRDPPFAKLDLISCRNVLIYFDADLQRAVIPMLHHCLNKPGYLFLGQSETIAGFRDLFAPVDKDHRVFMKTGENRPLAYAVPEGREVEGKLSTSKLAVRRYPAREAQRQADHLLLARFTPPGVLVNDRLEVVQFRGRTGAYLEQPPGQPQANLLRMAREDLVAHLHDAMERAKAQSTAVRKKGLRIQSGSESRVVNLEVVPLAEIHDSTERFFLVLFEEPQARIPGSESPESRRGDLAPPTGTVPELARLQAELVATKDYLQSLISDHQTTTDELAATYEEMVAANEELQSTNEELQSAREELQSTNEELSTVNDQLRSRNQDLDQFASDLVNVLSSVEIPVIIVDLELRVRRFTPSISEVASFIPEDVGRPIDDLKLKLRVDDLPDRIRGVIDRLSPREWEVQRQDGRWFRIHIRPYRTIDQRLDGAVVAFIDVDVLKQARKEAEIARDYARNIVETVTTALVVLDPESRVLSANAAFLRKFSVTAEQIVGAPLSELGVNLMEPSPVGNVLQRSLKEHSAFSAFEITTELPHDGHRVLSLTGRPIPWEGDQSMMLLAIDDISDLRAFEAERALLLDSEKQARIEAERANHAKDLFLATLSHELRTPLSTILMSAQLLKQLSTEDPRIERASASIERATRAQSKLIDDLLDVSRVVSGKLLLDLGSVDLEAVVRNGVDISRPAAHAKSLELDCDVRGRIGAVYGDELRLQQVVNNLLSNAIKFTPHGGRVAVRLERAARNEACLTVTDTGMGIRPDILPQLFNRFVQADPSVTRNYGGLGLGLSIIRHLVEAHGGSVEAESPGEGQGATFRVKLPLGDGASEPTTVPRANVRKIEGVRVLLVEDDDDIRQSYAAMLEEFGAEVQSAHSAAAAFRALEETLPHVILSDIAMPGEDGFSFMQKVRCLPPERGGDVPAAAITALASNEERQRALDAGFQLHIAKPIGAAQLITIVNSLLDLSPSPARASD